MNYKVDTSVHMAGQPASPYPKHSVATGLTLLRYRWRFRTEWAVNMKVIWTLHSIMVLQLNFKTDCTLLQYNMSSVYHILYFCDTALTGRVSTVENLLYPY